MTAVARLSTGAIRPPIGARGAKWWDHTLIAKVISPRLSP